MPDDLISAVKAHVTEPPLPPVGQAAVDLAEARLGFAMPPLLRRLYLEVGDGRFGPGYGLLSLHDVGDGELSLVDTYLDMRKDSEGGPSWAWPSGLVAFCDWGCNMYSCLDCNGPINPVSTYAYVEGPMDYSFFPTRDSLESWLRDWLAGVEVFE